MYKPGYYLFEGNILEYDGDSVHDIDSNTYLPEGILEYAEYIGAEL